jgi:hypothetical protein
MSTWKNSNKMDVWERDCGDVIGLK